MRLALLIAMLAACSRESLGTLKGPCKPDGTCNSPNLECRRNYDWGPDYICVIDYSKLTANPTDSNAVNWNSEATQFCNKCTESCGASGLKECHWADTTVWGAKPTVCECK